MKCPKCGSTNCHLTITNKVTSRSKGYGCMKGCCGAVLLGPLGLLCGMCGSGKVTTTSMTQELWVCNECGSKFTSEESLESNAVKAEFYYEHTGEYPQYAEYPMIKTFTNIYATELMASPMANKIITRNENNQGFEEHKRRCGNYLEKELILFAVEDGSGLIVTLKKMIVNDYCINIESIKTICLQGLVIYINGYCVRFSTDDNARIIFELLNKILSFKPDICYERPDSYTEVLSFLQERYYEDECALRGHYSSQKEYKEYVEKLDMEAWKSFEKNDAMRYQKYREYRNIRDGLVIPIRISVLLVAICTAIFAFVIGANFLGIICISAVVAGGSGYLGYSQYKKFANLVDKLNKELLPKELIEIDVENKKNVVEKEGKILYKNRDKYISLPGLADLEPVKDYKYIKYVPIISKIACIIYVLAVAGFLTAWVFTFYPADEAPQYEKQQNILLESESYQRKEYAESSTEERVPQDNRNDIVSQEEILPEDTEGFILPESSSRYLTMEDLEGLDKAELRLARNEIYARHGRKYETEDLNEYFSSQPWYHGYLSAEEFDDSVFNEYEKANLDFIKIAEGIEPETKTPENPWEEKTIEYGIKLEDVWSGTYSSDGVPVKMQL